MNKQVKGGIFDNVINNACKQDGRLDDMASKYIENKAQRKGGLDGLHKGIEDPKKAFKLVMPHQENEFDAGYQEDKNRVPNCSEERKKIFYMLALKKAAIKKGKGNNRNYKPYFDHLFTDVNETKKQEAKDLLINKFGFTIKDEESEVAYKEPKKFTEKSEEPKKVIKEPEGSMSTDVPGEQTQASVGGSRKYTKNLCHKKSVKNPNKCKKVKGCKPASGPKRTFCRKSKNKNNKTQKKSTPFRFNLGERLQGLTKKAAKELRKLQ